MQKETWLQLVLLIYHSILSKAASVQQDRKSTRLNSSDGYISYAVLCLKKKSVTGSPHPARGAGLRVLRASASDEERAGATGLATQRGGGARDNAHRVDRAETHAQDAHR